MTRAARRAAAALALAAPAPFAAAAATDAGAADREVERLAADAWEWRLSEDPLLATKVGDHRFDDRLPEAGLAAEERRQRARRAFLARAAAIDRGALGERRRIDLEVLERWLADEAAEHEHGAHLVPITNRAGFWTEFPQLPAWLALETTEDYDAYVSRLGAFRAWAQGHIELMRAGLERGVTLPRVVLEGIEASIDPHVVRDPEESLLFAPLTRFPAVVPAGDRERLTREARRAIQRSVVPGYREFRAFMVDEYRPAARTSVGASALPDGEAFYAHRVRRFTTLELSPREVHRLGLAEVARIRDEMSRVIEETGFEGDFGEFLAFLRTDPRFFVEEPERLLERTAFVLKKMDGMLPRLFGRLPRTPYGIDPVPAYIAPRTTTAYYEPAPADATRGGTYFVNTYGLDARPLYEVEALSLHEAVPGHHLQIALAHELEDVLPFRRHTSFGAFVEGWALYAERLGLEAGFYEDPYSDFGRLTYEMWRACRLVVDTGLHAFGWSRQKAIDFMAENTALSLLNVRNEVDRYIAWPGQALGYKIGELEIRRLRDEAERALGPRFDLRAFHDAVLAEGSIPLEVLRREIERHVAERASSPEGVTAPAEADSAP